MLSGRDFHTEDDVHSCSFEKYDEMSTNRTGSSFEEAPEMKPSETCCSHSAVTVAQARFTECVEYKHSDPSTQRLEPQNEIEIFVTNSQAMQDTEERDPEVCARHAKNISRHVPEHALE